MKHAHARSTKVSFSSRIEALAEQHRRSDRYRFLEANARSQGRLIEINGCELVNFCSNDYLGLSNDSRVNAAAIAAIQSHGFGSGAAALLSGRSDHHEVLEQALAQFLGRDSALLFSSGYLANLGVISALVTRHDIVHQDKLNHASLIDAVKLSGAKSIRYPHADYDRLNTQLSGYPDHQQWIVTDGVFSMDGDIADLPTIVAGAKRHNATLICDDAHGFGVLGDGRGICDLFSLTQHQVPVYIVTFGKALGTLGAAVIGERALIDLLIQTSRTFIYDTALPPAVAAATNMALTIVRDEPERRTKLDANVRLFREGCATNRIPLSNSVTPIQPIIVGDDRIAVDSAASLRNAGIYVRAVRPPTVPVNTARLRICISAAHSSEDIERLVTALATSIPGVAD